MFKNRFMVFISGLLYIAIMVGGCTDNVYTGKRKENIRPTVRITNAPLEREETSYRIHMYWAASDSDGKVKYCEYCIVSGDPYGFSPSDTSGSDKWTKTIDEDTREVYNDREFAFECDSITSGITYDENEHFTKSEETKSFFIRAIDWEGGVSEVAHISFNSWTLAPKTQITAPKNKGIANFSTVITFEWKALDYIDNPVNTQIPDSIRYMNINTEDIDWPEEASRYPNYIETPYRYMDILMNLFPKLFDKYYEKEYGGSGWIEYATADTGSSTKIGDDEYLNPNAAGKYVFAVQAKDEAGAVTSIMDQFSGNNNVVCYVVSPDNPTLRITEATIGSTVFTGARAARAAEARVPPGIELKFTWSADASEYGGKVTAFRYGWDVVNLDDPDAWDTKWGKDIQGAVKTFYSSIHTLNVQVMDDGGHITTGLVEVQIIDFSMNRPLLLVDDWGLGSTDLNGHIPTESEHDAYVSNIIRPHISTFNDSAYVPNGDVFDTRYDNISIEDIANYENMIWIYGDQGGNWEDNVTFIPESAAGGAGSGQVNLIKLFLSAGGHVLTYGLSGKARGGLSDCFSAIQGLEMDFPRVVSQDIVPEAFEWDNSWRNAMAYDDYGVDVMDRIRYHDGDREYNSMRMAVIDNNDPMTLSYPGLPDTLRIRESLSSNGAYWDDEYWSARGNDTRCGIWYVECFNDRDHMNIRNAYMVPEWFHPMYRMKACSSFSDFNDAPVALVITKNANIKPIAEGTIAANSFHFGFPLWYLSNENVSDLLDVIFTEWRIKNK